MKTKFSKILGVGLTLALLTSLLLTAAPVSALTQPTVTVDDPTISEVTDYSILFNLGVRLGGDTSTVTFAANTATVVTITAGDDGATIGYDASSVTNIAPSGTGTLTPSAGGTETFETTSATGGGDVVLTLTAGSITIALTSGTATISDAALPDSIIIEFDEDTDITGVVAAGVTIAATYGMGTQPWLTPVPATNVVVDEQELTIDLPLNHGNIGVGAMVEVVVSGVKNPDEPGDYTLDVSTTHEDAKTATFEIEAPDIGVLPGVVEVLNPTDIPMGLFTGDDAIIEALKIAKADYTIVVGPGEYDIDEMIYISSDQAGLTLKSSDGATVTIIDASGCTGNSVELWGDNATFEGFTIADSTYNAIAIYYGTEGITVKNNIITDAPDCGITLAYVVGYPDDIVESATVSGNVIKDCGAGINLAGCAKDNTISDNTITGSSNESLDIHAGIGDHPTEGNTFTGNTITANQTMGIRLKLESIGAVDLVVFKDNLIEGNTISENEGDGIWLKDVSVDAEAYLDISGFAILNNDITDNEGVGILVEVWDAANTISFNTITGNDAEADGYGIQNDAKDEDGVNQTLVVSNDGDVNAAFNWWGTADADDIAAMVTDTDTSAEAGVTTYEPFLADTLDAVFSASDVAAGADSLDAKDTVGVAVSVTDTGDADVISVAKYEDNPQAAIAGSIAFFDVYVAGDFSGAETEAAIIKFYAGDAQTDVYMWNPGTLTWGDPLDADFSAYGGYVYVTVDPANLAGTPFALVAGVAAEIPAPKILSPDVGDDTVSLRPVFAWEAVPDATGYYFQLADNASFVLPLIKMEGDMGRLFGTTYAYVGEELPYSTPYHWRVKAVSGTIGAGDLAESDWTGGVFITMDEPVEPTPPVVVEPTPPAPPAPIIEPIVEVIVPPATAAITPGWIYAIIAVGGVLVIALLILIVRTRRVA